MQNIHRSTSQPRAECKSLPPHSTGLVLASFPDLGLETALDRVDRAPRSARLAGDEEDTVLLDEESIWGFARLASDVFDCAARMSWRHDRDHRQVAYQYNVARRSLSAPARTFLE